MVIWCIIGRMNITVLPRGDTVFVIYIYPIHARRGLKAHVKAPGVTLFARKNTACRIENQRREEKGDNDSRHARIWARNTG